MLFQSFTFSPETKSIEATAQGHPNDVIVAFREACRLIMSDHGAWRITRVRGECTPEMRLDSEMAWQLRAELKP